MSKREFLYGVLRKSFQQFFRGTRFWKLKLEYQIGVPNLGFHQFFHNKGLMHSKRHTKKDFYVWSLKKIVWAVFQILTSGFICSSPYPFPRFSVFAKTWKYCFTYLVLCIKFRVFILISFGDIKSWIFTTVSH